MKRNRTGAGSAPPAPASPRLRDLELEVAREIADSFLTASSSLEVYRLALARVTPLVGASFASVFLADEHEPGLFRLACAQNWPQSSARFLGEVRIREGRGPTGRAIRRCQPVEVVDVFADRELQAWWEPARELGFVSMTSLPLAVEERVLGALSFYFSEPQQFDDDARTLLTVVAHQLAATADRAALLHDLQASHVLLERENDALLRRLADVEAALDRERSGGSRGGRKAADPVSGRTGARDGESR